jgi:4-hydroxy-3-methylbut-2-enyl diphosphate reductase
VGLTAGASAPEVLVHDVIARCAAGRGVGAQDGRYRRDGEVPLPKGLKIDAATGLEIEVRKTPETGA